MRVKRVKKILTFHICPECGRCGRLMMYYPLTEYCCPICFFPDEVSSNFWQQLEEDAKDLTNEELEWLYTTD